MYAHEIIGIRRLVVGGFKSFEIKYVWKIYEMSHFNETSGQFSLKSTLFHKILNIKLRFNTICIEI